MPVRDNLTSARIDQVVNGVATAYVYNKYLGMKQSISALNNAGPFTPGVYRNNPVKIWKYQSTSVPGFSTGEDVYLANTGIIQGDLASVVTNACSMTVGSSNYDYYTSWDATMAGNSLQKAYASMNEAELDVGVMLGELRETFEGIVNPASALRNYVKLANRLRKNSKVPRLSDTLDMLSGSWLEWAYGVVPLMLAIEDIIQHVKAQARVFNDKMLRKGGKVKREQNFRLSGGSYPGSYRIDGTCNIDVKTKYHSKVFYKYVAPLSWQERYGLDLSAVPGIAWELLRLSFVWDWFFSVGAWLGSLRMNDARQVLGSCTSQKCTVTVSSTTTSVKFKNMVSAKVDESKHEVVYELLDRRVNQALPVSPVVNREALSLKRQIDALALLWQSMPKLRR